MPQLMPLFWISSVFMVLFVLLMMIIIYIVYIKMNMDNCTVNKYNIDLIWMW